MSARRWFATPSFVAVVDGDCEHCGAHIPAGATAGFVDDELWCQPCRYELAARQEAQAGDPFDVIRAKEAPLVEAVRQRQRAYGKAWEQVLRLANRPTQ